MIFNEIKTLEEIKATLEHALEYELLNDRAHLKHSRILERRWKIVCRALNRLKKLGRKYAR